MNNRVKKPYPGRMLVSLLMFFFFILLIPSGIMMHLNDTPGLNNSKHIAMLIHNFSALFFVISGVIHIKNNFSLMKKYISGSNLNKKMWCRHNFWKGGSWSIMNLQSTAGLLSGIAWTITYIALVYRGFKDKWYGMPMPAMALNIAWELTFPDHLSAAYRWYNGYNHQYYMDDLRHWYCKLILYLGL